MQSVILKFFIYLVYFSLMFYVFWCLGKSTYRVPDYMTNTIYVNVSNIHQTLWFTGIDIDDEF